ncbi:MAG: hypothetical protein KJ000_33075 [Pirellulaceae bacterium]|nr:hypothetical protein [Pirellulaceae bacterium]
MNRQLALRRLCWKEVRQVLPLVWMQLGLGICFQVLLLFQRQNPFTPQMMLIAGMPSLFALGVGALLVGQEKERRTLDWMRWLPVASGELMLVKLTVGLLALVAVWCMNLLLLPIFVLPSGGYRTAAWAHLWLFDPGWEYLWPLQSVLFLLAGFATAWTFRSSLAAMLALVPIALLPGAITLAVILFYEWASSDRSFVNELAPWVMGVTMVVLSLLMLRIGWRRGMRYLAAEEFVDRRTGRAVSLFNPWDDTPVWTYPAFAPAAMLIWQFLRQNQSVFLGIVGMLLGALVLLISDPTFNSGRPFVAAFLLLLATSWLGVLAFHGDALHERIRFLAERGISPAKVWYTRHVPALSLLALVLFAGAFALPGTVRSGARLAVGYSPPLILSVVFLAMCTYAVSQAVGQILRSATIAAITAPVLAWISIVFGSVMVVQMGTPVWLMGSLSLLPWVATFVLMRRWMDNRLGWGFWGAHACFLAVGIALPLIPLGLAMMVQPNMPGDVRRQLTAEAQRYGSAFAEPREPVLRFHDAGSNEPSALSRREEGQMIQEQLENEFSFDPGSIRFVPRVATYLMGEARLARMALEQDAESESQRNRYRDTMSLIGTFVQRLRLSWRLIDQDGADLMEIWLVNELSRPNAQSLLDADTYTGLIRTLADDAGRQAARRRALVMSWAAYRAQFRSDAPETPLGGYAWRGQAALTMYLANPFSRQRAADYLTWQMLQRLEECESSQDAERIRELARYWGVPTMFYGVGMGGEFLRADDPSHFAMPVEGMFRQAPGSQWHAGWERLARELANK